MPPKNNQDKKTVHLVIQRYRWCSILLNESVWRSVGTKKVSSSATVDADPIINNNDEGDHCGWLVYTSFASGANQETVEKAVLALFKMPLGTWGHWQEKGSDRPQSLANMMQQLHEEQEKSGGEVAPATATTDEEENDSSSSRLSVVLCPQANLVSKLKQNGKSIQYHGQCDKSLSEQLFLYFGLCLKAQILEHQCELRQQAIPDALQAWKKVDSLDTALDESNWSSWCEQLEMVSVVLGSFGKRQGLEFCSDMGPFCHTVQM